MIFFFSFFGVEHYKVDDNISIKFGAMNYRFKQCKDKLAIKIIQINENNSVFSLKKKKGNKNKPVRKSRARVQRFCWQQQRRGFNIREPHTFLARLF